MIGTLQVVSVVSSAVFPLLLLVAAPSPAAVLPAFGSLLLVRARSYVESFHLAPLPAVASTLLLHVRSFRWICPAAVFPRRTMMCLHRVRPSLLHCAAQTFLAHSAFQLYHRRVPRNLSAV